MPAARQKLYVIGITSSSSAQYDIVSIKNITTGETLRRINQKIITLDSQKRALVDLANLPSGFSNNDIIKIKVIGDASSGSATHTVNTAAGGADVSITAAANPTGGVSVR